MLRYGCNRSPEGRARARAMVHYRHMARRGLPRASWSGVGAVRTPTQPNQATQTALGTPGQCAMVWSQPQHGEVPPLWALPISHFKGISALAVVSAQSEAY